MSVEIFLIMLIFFSLLEVAFVIWARVDNFRDNVYNLIQGLMILFGLMATGSFISLIVKLFEAPPIG